MQIIVGTDRSECSACFIRVRVISVESKTIYLWSAPGSRARASEGGALAVGRSVGRRSTGGRERLPGAPTDQPTTRASIDSSRQEAPLSLTLLPDDSIPVGTERQVPERVFRPTSWCVSLCEISPISRLLQFG